VSEPIGWSTRVPAMSYSEEMAQNAEADWFEVIANLERLLAPT
jgi:hypothetical protein